MYQLIALYAIIAVAVVTSVMGAVFILRGSRIFDLQFSTRNFMYVGACCAMCSGFVGATVCMGSLVTTQWHSVGAMILPVIGIFATVHLFVDLSDRLRILKRTDLPESQSPFANFAKSKCLQ